MRNDPTSPRKIVWSWERLRIVYNAVLLPPGIWVLGKTFNYGLEPDILIFWGLAFGLGANLCYFLGPLIELYLTAIHFTDDFSIGRKILFTVGLALSLCIVAICGFTMKSFLP